MASNSTFQTNLKLLHEESWFQAFVQTDLIPNIPEPYQSTDVTSVDQTALEAMKASAMRAGYKHCLAKLGVDV